MSIEKAYISPNKEDKEIIKNYIKNKSNIEVKNTIYETLFLEVICLLDNGKVILYNLLHNKYEIITDTEEEFKNLMNKKHILQNYLFMFDYIQKLKTKLKYFNKDIRFILKDNYYDLESVDIISRKLFYKNYLLS